MYHAAIATFRTLLPGDMITLTPETLEQTLNILLSIPHYKELDRDGLSREIQSLYNIRSEPFAVLEDRNVPWLPNRKADITWSFWNRYRTYLESKDFAPEPLLQLDRLTDAILDRLFDPSVEGIIAKKRGLVVGQVQSGKTSNYTGLICKAADAGYKLIVVLAGLHNNLRSQTQLRLDEGFLGRDTITERIYRENGKPFGAGFIKVAKKLVAHSLTSSKETGDFRIATAAQGTSFDTDEPILLVVKKNVSVLARLHEWLEVNATPDPETGLPIIDSKSLLLIDDEADHASPNTSGDIDNATRTNRQIRGLLRLFRKSGYIGYTATPFANIFIDTDRDELFPSNFIINLKAPSNYIGPEQVFGIARPGDETPDTVLPMVRTVSDYGDLASGATGRNRPAPPTALPDSLHLAIRCFILVCAIRRLRGQVNEHNSMMVHISRFTNNQEILRQLVDNEFDYYQKGIDQNDPTVLKEMRQTFETDTADYRSFVTTSAEVLAAPNLRVLDEATAIHTWTQVKEHLNAAAAKIQVKEINGGSADVLNYFDEKTGLSVIAVGGDKLSRGLTLEGLSVSYFLRPSKMYDTLMQMGRWFGYRRGYVDLCRLFTSQTLNEWFGHIAVASEELREEFVYMTDVAKSTPADFALKVRTHPSRMMMISARNKMHKAVLMSFSMAGRLTQTYEFSKEVEAIRHNYDATKQFVKTLGVPKPGRKGGNIVWENRTARQVLGFLANYRTYPNLRRADTRAISRFIRLQLANKELIEWTVALLSTNNAAKAEYEVDGDTQSIGLFRRVQEPVSSTSELYYLRKSNILSPEHESLDLDPETEMPVAMDLTRQMRRKQKIVGEPSYPNGFLVRNEVRPKSRGLLLLYSLNPEAAFEEEDLATKKPVVVNFPDGLKNGSLYVPIVGFAISFPGSNHHADVEYMVHEDLLDQLVFNDPEPDGSEDDDDQN